MEGERRPHRPEHIVGKPVDEVADEEDEAAVVPPQLLRVVERRQQHAVRQEGEDG